MNEKRDILVDQYIAQFGHTFTSVGLGSAGWALAERLIQEALAGKRGPVRDRDLGIQLKKGERI